jgi:hypothetical protein
MPSPLGRSLVAIAWLVAVAILVQAVLAGRGWFIEPELFDLHGVLGNATFLLAVVATALAWITRASRTSLLLTSLLVLGLIGQIGLGYAGRRSGIAEASAMHVPLGVALLGLSVAAAMLVSRDSRT